jgi:beta-lactamase superfamily II metal-dependent hydrolase
MNKITVDMLDVEKGDSYVVELHNESEEKFSFVIDGGTREKSEALVSHVQKYHNGKINLAICTHPDTDHINGLINLFEQCSINHLFINDPRDVLSENTLLQKARNNLSTEEVSVFKSSFERIDELKKQAEYQGTTHHQSTFSDKTPRFVWGKWSVYILGPSEDLFKDIWLNEDVVRDWFNSDTIDNFVSSEQKKSVLDDPSVDTKPVNNSSIILLIEGYGCKYLFTGDAGKRALRDAMEIKDISNLTWFDVPHHGSRRNLDTQIINYLAPKIAYISSPGTNKHPRKTIIRALQNTGTSVYSTCKHGSVCHGDWQSRSGFSAIGSAWEMQ